MDEGVPRSGRGARLTFLTRRECCLCHEARAVVERVVPDYEVALEIIDVDTRDDLARAYGEQVPVLFVDGRRAFKFRVDERRLRRRLSRWRRGGTQMA